MFTDFFNIFINDIFETPDNNKGKRVKKAKSLNKPKRKYTKRTFKEKDCDVYYDPSFLFEPNMPGEYVSFEEVKNN